MLKSLMLVVMLLLTGFNQIGSNQNVINYTNDVKLEDKITNEVIKETVEEVSGFNILYEKTDEVNKLGKSTIQVGTFREINGLMVKILDENNNQVYITPDNHRQYGDCGVKIKNVYIDDVNSDGLDDITIIYSSYIGAGYLGGHEFDRSYVLLQTGDSFKFDKEQHERGNEVYIDTGYSNVKFYYDKHDWNSKMYTLEEAEYTLKNEYVDITARYPLIKSENVGLQKHTNEIIDNCIDGILYDFKDVEGFTTVDISYEVTRNDRFLSIKYDVYWYVDKAAHPNKELHTINIDLETGSRYIDYDSIMDLESSIREKGKELRPEFKAVNYKSKDIPNDLIMKLEKALYTGDYNDTKLDSDSFIIEKDKFYDTYGKYTYHKTKEEFMLLASNVYKYNIEDTTYYLLVLDSGGTSRLVDIILYKVVDGELKQTDSLVCLDLDAKVFRYNEGLYFVNRSYNYYSKYTDAIYLYKLTDDKKDEYVSITLKPHGNYIWNEIFNNQKPYISSVSAYISSIKNELVRHTPINDYIEIYKGEESKETDKNILEKLNSVGGKIDYYKADVDNDGEDEYFSRHYWFPSTSMRLHLITDFYDDSSDEFKPTNTLFYKINKSLVQQWFKEIDGKVFTFRLFLDEGYNYCLDVSLVEGTKTTHVMTYIAVAQEEIRLDSNNSGKEDTNTVDSNKLVGVWQDEAGVGATYSGKYHFYKDNTFKYFYSFYEEARRDYSISGKWSMENNRLKLKIYNKTIRENGKFKKSMLDESRYSLVDYDIIKHEVSPAQEITYSINNYNASTVDSPTSISIDGLNFYQLSIRPNDYTEFLSETK